MSLGVHCRLCLMPSDNYKALQNEQGVFNHIYEITIKYFDSLLLTTLNKADEYSQKCHVLCLSCWMPIKIFNEFKQNVISTRSILEEIFVDFEGEDQVYAINNQKNDNDSYKRGDGGEKHQYLYENVYVKPELDLEADYKEQEFINNEEATTSSLLEKTIVKVECDNQDDEIINYKNANDNCKSGDGRNFTYSYENVKTDIDLGADYKEQECISNDEAMTSLLVEKTVVKVECDDQVDEIINHKNVDNYNSDDGRHIAYTYENVYVKPDLEANSKEQQFTSNEEAITSSLLEKIIVKVECDDQVDEIIKQKNVNNKYNSDDSRHIAYSYENVYVKQDLEDNSKEQQFTSNEKLLSENIGIKVESDDQIDETICHKNIDNNYKDGNDDEHYPHSYENFYEEDGETQEEITTTEERKQNLIKSKDIAEHKNIGTDALISEWKPVLECDLCEQKTFSNLDKLRRHFKEKHKSKFYIKCCERKFFNRTRLLSHIQWHLNPDMLKCDICGKVISIGFMKMHKKLVHGKIKQLECEFCHKLFNLKGTLKRHLLTHAIGEKNFACKECDKTFVLEAQLKVHIKTLHNVDRVCNQCGKILYSMYALKKHLLEHAGIEKIAFACDVCDAEFDSPRSVKHHKDAFHNGSSTIHVCSICGKVSSNSKAAKDHTRSVHMKHNKNKCSYCGKGFISPKNLREHIATHTGEDLYQCLHCPKTFKYGSSMSKHCKKVHPVEWEKDRKKQLQLSKVNINHENQVVCK